MSKTKFFICKHCGNLVGMIKNTEVPLVCCGEKMMELVANTVDAAQEKHVPVVNVNGTEVTVDVGSVAHPMTAEHSIEWVYLQTAKGGQRLTLKPGDEPKVVFALTADDKAQTVFAYCNLHGLWSADI